MQCSRRERSWISSAVLAASAVCWSGNASAHEPYSITTEARALRTELTLHVTMAGSTAMLVCPDAVTEGRRLTSDAINRSRDELERCAKQLFTVISSGARANAKSATVALTAEGDFDTNVVYPIAPGALTLDAALLARLPDPMYGVELTVTGEGVFLGQTVLRRDARAFSVLPPSATDDSADSPAPSASAAPQASAPKPRASALPTNESVLSANRRPTLYVMLIALVTAAIVAWRLARSR